MLVPDPATRQALSWHNFTTDCLPPILLYYLTALLVITPRTFAIRLALLPITLYTAFRCAVRIDLVKGYPDEERLVYLGQGLLLGLTTLATRVSIWSFQLEPYRRLKPAANPLLDALDLAFNLRGIGWSWSKGLKLPEESRNTANTASFLFATFLSFLRYLLLFDATLYVVQSFDGIYSNPTGGQSIFDSTLPPIHRYLRSSFITLLSGLVIYFSILALYLFLSLISIAVLQHSPTQWPPLFHRPYLSTSLNQFWSCRWHQIFRHNFIAFGGAPLFFLFGHVGSVLGVFLTSGLLHYFGLWGMGRGTDFLNVAGFFIIMGVGTLFERFFKKMTGKRVHGFAGWLWTILWVLSWAHMLVEAWLSRGLAASLFAPQASRPSVLFVDFAKRSLGLPQGWGIP